MHLSKIPTRGLVFLTGDLDEGEGWSLEEESPELDEPKYGTIFLESKSKLLESPSSKILLSSYGGCRGSCWKITVGLVSTLDSS